MRHPVSTPSCFEEKLSGAVLGRVVGFAIVPGAPDDAQPGTSEDTDGVRVVAASGLCLGVDAGGPGIGVARVVGQAGKSCAQAVIAGPAGRERIWGAGSFVRCVRVRRAQQQAGPAPDVRKFDARQRHNWFGTFATAPAACQACPGLRVDWYSEAGSAKLQRSEGVCDVPS